MSAPVNTMAFKEWAVVCEALLDGRQHVLIRKGGIAEGRAGFEFRHKEFFLMPTRFHEQVARTTLPAGTELPEQPPAGMVVIQGLCRVVAAGLVTDPEALRRLTPYHILSEDTVTERFGYGKQRGVYVALVRAYRVSPAWQLPDSSAFGGCRSWVELPDPPALSRTPSVSDAVHDAVAAEVGKIPGWVV